MTTVIGQYRNSHEVGIVLGPSFFATDYGQRSDAQSYLKNAGLGIGLVYYYNFSDNSYRWRGGSSQYFAEHFKLRAEFSFASAKLEHYGHYVDPDKTSTFANQLRAMHGKAQVFNLGAALEFHFFEKRYREKWSPYVSLGLFAGFYNPSFDYDLGDWENDPSILPPKWADPSEIDTSNGFTGSVTGAFGSRIIINQFSEVLIELRWQYFFTDYIDALDAKNEPSNKYNDWTFYPHVGYIYYLPF